MSIETSNHLRSNNELSIIKEKYQYREELAKYLAQENKRVINSAGDSYDNALDEKINLNNSLKFPLLSKEENKDKSYRELGESLGIDLKKQSGREILDNMCKSHKENLSIERGVIPIILNNLT